jgi:hypothetical protein
VSGIGGSVNNFEGHFPEKRQIEATAAALPENLFQ